MPGNTGQQKPIDWDQLAADEQAKRDAEKNKKPFWDASQPYGGSAYAPGGQFYTPGTPGNVAPIQVASDRTGVTNPNLQSLDQIKSSLPNPNLNVAGPQFNQAPNVSSYLTNALDKKQGMGMADFGIPANVLDKMKAAEAQTINKGYEAQKEASKRLLHSMGLSNDAANFKAMQGLDSERRGNIYDSYNKADISNALEANKQYQQNLNDLVGAGSDLSKLFEGARQFNTNLGEQGRQFNVGAELTNSELAAKTAKWLEDAGMQRIGMNESIAEFLENLNLERLKLSQGLAADTVPLAGERLDYLKNTLGSAPTSYF